MASWDPVDIYHDEIGEEDKWDDDVVKDLEIRNSKPREFNRTHSKKSIDTTMTAKEVLEHDIIELVANQIYDKLTIYFNNTYKKEIRYTKGVNLWQNLSEIMTFLF